MAYLFQMSYLYIPYIKSKQMKCINMTFGINSRKGPLRGPALGPSDAFGVLGLATKRSSGFALAMPAHPQPVHTNTKTFVHPPIPLCLIHGTKSKGRLQNPWTQRQNYLCNIDTENRV